MELLPVTGGILLGWALGSNDAANIFGTGIAANLIKFRTAVILIAAFVIAGAVVEGSKVMDTVGGLSMLNPTTAFFSTFSAGLIVAIMSRLAIPVSTSQAIIGAIFGVGLLSNTTDFSILIKILICWLLTPVGGIFFSILFYRILGMLFESRFMSLHRRSAILQIGIVVAGSYGAYALGSNNVANVTGAYVGAGILDPLSAALIGSLSIILGVITYSKNVIYTIGKQIFPLEAFPAFVVVIAEAATVHVFTQIGVPVSASQAVVGAVLGIGIFKNIRLVSMKQIWSILIGWILTPLGAASLTILLISLF